MKANANQIRAALDAAAPDIRLFLLHGPDEAGAAELALRLSRTMGSDAERVDLDSGVLRSDPARLADEAASLSLFGGARFIRASGIGDEAHEALALLLDADRAGNPVVAIAPGMKATSKIVKLAIASPRALSFACYVPDGADADRLIAGIARDHGLRTTGATAHRLAAASAGDRAIATREIEKIALFLDAAPDRPREIDDATLDAIGADMGDAETSHAVTAALSGDAIALGVELARLREAGGSPIPVLRALARRLIAIAELRAEVEGGVALDAAMERQRVFFREKAATAKAVRHWSPVQTAGALAHVRKAERAIMASGTAGDVLAEAAMTQVARAAARSS